MSISGNSNKSAKFTEMDSEEKIPADTFKNGRVEGKFNSKIIRIGDFIISSKILTILLPVVIWSILVASVLLTEKIEKGIYTTLCILFIYIFIQLKAILNKLNNTYFLSINKIAKILLVSKEKYGSIIIGLYFIPTASVVLLFLPLQVVKTNVIYSIALVFFLIEVYLKKLARKKINTFVAYEKEDDKNKKEDTLEILEKSNITHTLQRKSITLRKLKHYEMPALSNESKSVINTPKKRKEEINNIYGLALISVLAFYIVILILSKASTGIVINAILIIYTIYQLVKIKFPSTNESKFRSSGTFTSTSKLLSIARIIYLLKKAFFFLNDKETDKLHPTNKVVLIWLWMFFLLFHSFSTSALKNIIIISFVVGLYTWISSAKLKIVEKYPYQLPFNLVELRVFGNNSLDRFLKTTKNWEWLGLRYRLDGPETTGSKFDDVVNYVSGSIEKSVIKSEEELKKAIFNFKKSPNSNLQFPLNSIQCDLNTWKQALQKILKIADVIVMDLSDFGDNNKGVVYEIEQLLNLFHKEKIVFLINNTTDINTLKNVFDNAFDKIKDNSPNNNCEDIVLYDYEELHNISNNDNEGNYLPALLYDKAKIRNENDLEPDPIKDWRFIYWANLPWSNSIRYLARLVFLILLVLSMHRLFQMIL